MFFGAKVGNVLPDWVDLNKVAIPQADEQQRLLCNVLRNANRSKKPLPRFWYFPRMLPAVVIMTGDDHANGGTAGRFNDYIAASTPGCSVDDWQCIRGTSYIYPDTPITDAQVQSYVSQGFEIALHVNTGCADWTPTTLTNFYTTQLTQFATQYPHAGAPKTNRTHCVVTSDYATQPQVELEQGHQARHQLLLLPRHLDPRSAWHVHRLGHAAAVRLAHRRDDRRLPGGDADDRRVGAGVPEDPDALLDNAINLGYYGAFTANMHTDFNPSNSSTGRMAIVNAGEGPRTSR